ncbi:glutamic-type intramembrane protease PrsW [Oceanobacillus bengalensis]|uniref:Protease PrsW n=1 Tax=Oceanobacillus bengalensis TaxID=1435466 RepID=A0A494Z288_9BACI|nr:glutamic-type intramembrane protease PrsW [Oceanobacillus bengalensis]RKQ16126.1 PrsW family intramembrane metalloprotease [Oceanobacillus bengalensis]
MFAICSAGLAPAIALLSYFYLKDRVTEPIPLIIRTFISGALLVFPIMFIQYVLTSEAMINNNFIHSFFFGAFFEEFFKWFIFMFAIFRHPEFNNHYDGIVYAVSISLGFASLENVLYLITNGIEYAFLRAFFPVSSHALFGVIMGFYLGKAKHMHSRKKWNMFRAFLIPFLLHGIYNYILLTVTSNWIFYIIPFMIFLWYVALHRAKVANQAVSIKK